MQIVTLSMTERQHQELHRHLFPGDGLEAVSLVLCGRRAGKRERVPHVNRPSHVRRHPLHVTLRFADGLPSLRGAAAQRVVRGALRAGVERFGMRTVHFSAQTNHLHLVCEAEDARALSRGMRSLAVRLALALNRLWKRSGAVIGDRYHARALKTPREVRHALRYVFQNARKHGVKLLNALDPCSSASTFDGWRERFVPSSDPTPLARARTWLLTIGWRRHGLLSIRGP